MKRRKPDLMILLAVFVSAGVLITGLTQAALRDAPPPQTSQVVSSR